ncbi:hypothetical protein JAO29_04590 [Edaphobacter sp. HDX4]
MARFLENHDEARAAVTFPREKHEAAAVITFLSPGLRFFHQGEFEGRTKRISPHLVRGPIEPTDLKLQQFYAHLLDLLRHPILRGGQWQLLECVSSWEGNWSSDSFIAFAWQSPDGERLLVTVNYAPHESQCYVKLPFSCLGGEQFRLRDLLSAASYDRDGNELQSRGLYLDLHPWRYHVFAIESIAPK